MRRRVSVKFVLWLSVLSAVLLAVVSYLPVLFVDFFRLPVQQVGSYLLSFYLVSLISGLLIIGSGYKRTPVLIRSVMGSTVIKFFLYILALSVFLLAAQGHAKEIGVYFFTFYVPFTIFEKMFLMRAMSAKDDIPDSSDS